MSSCAAYARTAPMLSPMPRPYFLVSSRRLMSCAPAARAVCRARRAARREPGVRAQPPTRRGSTHAHTRTLALPASTALVPHACELIRRCTNKHPRSTRVRHRRASKGDPLKIAAPVGRPGAGAGGRVRARHGLEHQAQVVAVLERAQQAHAVALALRVRARQLAQDHGLRLACARTRRAAQVMGPAAAELRSHPRRAARRGRNCKPPARSGFGAPPGTARTPQLVSAPGARPARARTRARRAPGRFRVGITDPSDPARAAHRP